MNKFRFFCVIAGCLGLFACNSEKLENDVVEVSGPAVITLNLKSEGMERASRKVDANHTTNTSITVSDLTIRYLDKNNSALKTEQKTLSGGSISLYDVPEKTAKLVVVGNNKVGSTGNFDEDFSSDATKQTNKSANVTVYGISGSLTPAGNVVGDGSSGNVGQNYAKFTTTVTVSPVVSRLEIKGLKFVPSTTDPQFSKLTLKKAYINGFLNTGSFATTGTRTVSASDFKEIKLTDSGIDNNIGKFETALDKFPLVDKVASNNVITDEVIYDKSLGDGLKSPTFPDGNKIFGYNFFVDGNTNQSLPKFTLQIGVEYLSTDPQKPATVYAVIAKYKKTTGGEEITKFEEGKLYQITSLNLPEDALTPDPSGKQEIMIEATVDVTPWEIVTTTGEWAGAGQ